MYEYEYLVIKRKNEIVGLERDYGFSHSVTSCLSWDCMVGLPRVPKVINSSGQTWPGTIMGSAAS